MNRIDMTFRRLKTGGRKAFIPYIMAGDPDLAKSMERVLLLQECGADIIELGVPFSDPVADGPTIQRAAERALLAGVSLKKMLAFMKELRKRTQVPVIFMTYYNPVFKYGEEKFVADAADAGVDGLIIPDLPPEEAGNLIKNCRSRKIDTIFLVAPTSTPERMKRIAAASRGFIYYVSMTGITGSKLSLEDQFGNHVGLLREMSDKPVAVGFGVSTPDDAGNIARVADGVIVGSAIVKKFHEDPDNARDFIKNLREAI
ncbi:MAG TPA: tryptophan synthase subunit alpha [Dissulfurispiraceae bacterium]|nr:tryptophan synthase subunit alpha [Dissulfurispiraceae bacterium]